MKHLNDAYLYLTLLSDIISLDGISFYASSLITKDSEKLQIVLNKKTFTIVENSKFYEPI